MNNRSSSLPFRLLVLIASAILSSACLLAAAGSADSSLIQLEEVKWPSPEWKYPGAVAGRTDGVLFVFGGENAPAGGRVLSLSDHSDSPQWAAVEAPFSRSWAAVARGTDESIVIGGIESGAAGPVVSSAVDRIRWRDGKLQREPLQPLPVPLAGAGAALIGKKLYVVGGIRSPDAERAESSLWMLDLAASVPAWKELEPLPVGGRVLPAVSSQYDVLQVFGGRDAASVPDGSRVWQASNETWVYRPVPFEGSTIRGWVSGAPAAAPHAAAASVPTGQAHSYLLGADESPSVKTPFSLPAPSGPQPVRLFHVLTDSWVDTGVRLPGVHPVAVPGAPGTFIVFGGDDGAPVSAFSGLRRTRNLAFIDYAVIAAYFLFLAGIGWYFSRQKESSSEYSLGSRKVQWWAAGISMFATGASAISFMAIPALAFATNLIWVFPILTLILSYFVQAHIIFPLLRRLQLTSTFEYLEQRFNKTLRLIASAQQMLLLTFGRAAVVLVLPSIAIATTTGLNVFVSVIVMGILTTIYTTMGGFKAVIWTEVFQGILKFVAPVAMIYVCIRALPGGFGEFVETGKNYHKFDIALLSWDITLPVVWILIMNTFLDTTVKLAGDQPMIQRVFSAPEHEVRRVAFMNVLCGILISVVVNILGIAIFAYFHAHPGLLDAGTQNDQIIPLFSTQALPPGLAGVVIAAIFASAMATVASNMNSVSTVFVEDFYIRFRPDADDKARLRMLKLSSYMVGFLGTLMAVLLAALPIKSMMATWIQIGALLGGGIVGVYSLGMITRRANGIGAVSGAIISVVGTLLLKSFSTVHWMVYPLFAVFSCMISGYLISLIFPFHKKDLTGLTIFTPRPEALPAKEG